MTLDQTYIQIWTVLLYDERLDKKTWPFAGYDILLLGTVFFLLRQLY